MVRCWKCGAFTRPEIEQLYLKLSEQPHPQFDRSVDLPEVDEETVRQMFREDPAAAAGDSWERIDNLTGSDDEFDVEFDGELLAGDDDLYNDDLSDGEGDMSFSDDFAGLQDDDGSRPIPASASMQRTGLDEDPVASSGDEAEAPATNTDVKASAAPAPKRKKAKAPSEEDALLSIAAKDEKESQKRRKSKLDEVRKAFVVFCPQGCKIKVSEAHRGKVGKCPKCGSSYVVPSLPKPAPAAPSSNANIPAAANGKAAAKTVAAPEFPTAPTQVGAYSWLTDVKVHTVFPAKVKAKAGALASDGSLCDVALCADGLLQLTYAAKGLFGADKKKAAAARKTAQDLLAGGGDREKLPKEIVGKWRDLASLGDVPFLQPDPTSAGPFKGATVFGEGRIAVKIADAAEKTGETYLSFTLSEFRLFSQAVGTAFQWSEFGSAVEIPLADTIATHTCALSSEEVSDLRLPIYYKADPTYKLTPSGWRCGGCQIVISEAARAKEKLGGANGKAIAKTKCPKCSAKMGDFPVYGPPERVAPKA